jgi:membrane-associated phospholipid phosphatase
MGALLLTYRKVRLPWLDFPRLFQKVYPILYIAIIFDSLAHVVAYVHTWRADDLLMQLDRIILGVDPTLFLEGYLSPFAVELLSYLYVLYFALPLLLVWLLWRQRRPAQITDWACLITIALYSNYLLYIAFPAAGPRFHIEHTHALEGAFLANSLMDTLNALESNKYDVFPSAHVNAALVTLYGFLRFYRKLTIPVAIVVLGIILSTVYLRYHYVVDVFAGMALAAVAIAGGELYCRMWRPAPAVDHARSLTEELAGEPR